MRTNIEIDDALIERAMKIYRMPTKRGVVDLALRRLVQAMDRPERLTMEGTGWDGDLSALREDARPRRRKRR